MAGYLEDYGVADARREKVIKWLVITLVVLLVGGGIGYFTFRSWPAKHKLSAFLDDLKRQDYRAAYALWGCTATSPCKDYTFEKFMEDWGPHGQYAGAGAASLKKTRYCGPGVILTLNTPNSGEVPLWYERRDGTLGFSPWPVCVPQPKAYQ